MPSLKGQSPQSMGEKGSFLLSSIIRMFFIFWQFHIVNNMDIYNSVKLFQEYSSLRSRNLSTFIASLAVLSKCLANMNIFILPWAGRKCSCLHFIDWGEWERDSRPQNSSWFWRTWLEALETFFLHSVGAAPHSPSQMLGTGFWTTWMFSENCTQEMQVEPLAIFRTNEFPEVLLRSGGHPRTEPCLFCLQDALS